MVLVVVVVLVVVASSLLSHIILVDGCAVPEQPLDRREMLRRAERTHPLVKETVRVGEDGLSERALPQQVAQIDARRDVPAVREHGVVGGCLCEPKQRAERADDHVKGAVAAQRLDERAGGEETYRELLEEW